MNRLELHALPPSAHAAAVLEAFDRLAPGESLLLVHAADPSALLPALQRERPFAYDWLWMADGPSTWQVRLARRTAHRAGAATVGDQLGFDHDRLDELLLAARQAWVDGATDEAREPFAAFAAGLRRHIHAEERVLFPAFEKASGQQPGFAPTAVMCAEHREIEQLLGAISAALAAGAARECPEVGALAALLLAHNRKEEHVLYPMTDRLVPPDERIALCHAIEAD